MPIDAVLLDAFGTVIHAEPAWEVQRADCLRAVHASWRGVPIPLARFLDAYEAARAEQHARVKEAYAEFDFPARFEATARACGAAADVAHAWGADAAELYHRYQERLIHAYDEPGPALAALKQAGYRVALVSNYAHAGVLHDALTRLGIRARFDALVVSGDVGFMKPHASVYQRALDALGVREPARAAMVGDSISNDVVGAKRHGLRAIWSPYPRQHPAPPPPRGADATIESLADLPRVLAEL